MKATDVMSRPVVFVRAGTPVREAIVLLTENGFAALPVVDERERIVGLVTEADVLVGGPEVSEDPATTVGAVMTSPEVVMPPDAEAGSIVEVMLARDLRCVPIVDGDLLMGVVCRADLLRTLVRDDDVIGARVRQLLLSYAGWRRRWLVDVDGGVVTVSGRFRDDAERRIVVALTGSVAGVARVEVRPEQPGLGATAPAPRQR